MRGKAQRVARRAQTRLQNSGVTGPQLTKFFSDVEGVIGGIKACVRVESSSVRCGMPALTVVYANFCRFALKSVTLAMSIERSRKDGRIDHAQHMYILKIWRRSDQYVRR